jgi:quercetin dioxygenase-like cupin family protein
VAREPADPFGLSARIAESALMPVRPVPEDLHPTFAEEALEHAGEAERARLLPLAHVLADALPAHAEASTLRARLLAEVARPPERYAPFSRQLGELYDLPPADVRRLLELSAEPRAFRPSGLPGIRKLRVEAGPGCAGAQAYLVRFAAGVRFPAHRHDGRETALLLSGGYIEDGGRCFGVGDVHAMDPGTSHGFTIDADQECVAATVLFGKLNFRSLPLRLLARLMGH